MAMRGVLGSASAAHASQGEETFPQRGQAARPDDTTLLEEFKGIITEVAHAVAQEGVVKHLQRFEQSIAGTTARYQELTQRLLTATSALSETHSRILQGLSRQETQLQALTEQLRALAETIEGQVVQSGIVHRMEGLGGALERSLEATRQTLHVLQKQVAPLVASQQQTAQTAEQLVRQLTAVADGYLRSGISELTTSVGTVRNQLNQLEKRIQELGQDHVNRLKGLLQEHLQRQLTLLDDVRRLRTDAETPLTFRQAVSLLAGFTMLWLLLRWIF